MSDPTRINRVNAQPLPGITTPRSVDSKSSGTTNKTGANGPTFAEVLRSQQGLAPTAVPGESGAGSVRFSAHAQTRLQSRQITLGEGQIQRLQGAVQRAAGKGSRDALVLMDDLAMVVSVTNRTVVTVVDKDNLKQNVFTNIDSAVIA